MTPRLSVNKMWWLFTTTAVVMSIFAEFRDGLQFYKTSEIHVSPTGSDWFGNGSQRLPKRSIQRALDRVQPGVSVILHPGTYTERIHFRSSGTVNNPITLRAIQPGTAIISGAMVDDLFKHAKWQSEGDGIVSTETSYPIYWLTYKNKCVFRCTWGNLQSLRDLVAKPNAMAAFHWLDGRLYLWLPDGDSLSSRDLTANAPVPEPREWGEFKSANLYLEADHIRIQDIRFEYGIGNGISFWNAENVTVENCSFYGTRIGMNLGGIKPPQNVVITHCLYQNFPQADWEKSGWLNWGEIYARYPHSTLLRAGTGPLTIENNVIVHGGDAIGASNPADSTSSVVIRRNWISECTDDAFELDGTGTNVTVSENWVHDVHESLGLSPVTNGPLYVHHNLFTHPYDGINGAQLKLMGVGMTPDPQLAVRNCLIDSNIFLGNWLCWWDGIKIENVDVSSNFFRVRFPINPGFSKEHPYFPPGVEYVDNLIEERKAPQPWQSELNDLSSRSDQAKQIRNSVISAYPNPPGPTWWDWQNETSTLNLHKEAILLFPTIAVQPKTNRPSVDDSLQRSGN